MMWISFPSLQQMLGKDPAYALCANLGGVSIYVPHKAEVTHKLAKIIGMRAMETLCEQFRGEYITVPAGGVRKERILALLDQGKTKKEIALACGVTERYVYLLSSLHSGSRYEKDQYALL